jgi:hypothetical protein
MTVAAILRVGATNVGTGAPATIAEFEDAGLTATGFAFRIGPSDGSTDRLGYVTSAAVNAPTLSVTPSDGWALVAASKASGAAAPRFHKYVYSTDTWTRENAATTLPDSSITLATGRLGATVNTSTTNFRFFDGSIAAVAVFGSALSDDQISSLPHSLAPWASLGPVAMWVLDQQAANYAIVDWTGGGANQTAITGTTVGSNSVPLLGYGHPIILSTRTASIGGGDPNPAPITAPIGLTATAETAQPIRPATAIAFGPAFTAETVQPVRPAKAHAAGLAATAESASPAAPAKSLTVGQAAILEVAQPTVPATDFGVPGVQAVGQAGTTELALPIVPAKTAVVVAATTTETVGPFAPVGPVSRIVRRPNRGIVTRP